MSAQVYDFSSCTPRCYWPSETTLDAASTELATGQSMVRIACRCGGTWITSRVERVGESLEPMTLFHEGTKR